MDGKQILELDQFIDKLEYVLENRTDLFVVARSDSVGEEEQMKRAIAFDEAGADAILIDGLESIDIIKKVAKKVKKPLMFNQLAGGKSPRYSLSELADAGISLVNYSTPCLFAAQEAIEKSMLDLKENDGTLPDTTVPGTVDLAACNALLNDNLANRDVRLK